jgi:hypothetical protein
MAIDSVVFGFGYRARSGKDSAVAEIIAQRGLRGDIVKTGEHTYHIDGYDIRRYAFADALKREVTAAVQPYGSMWQWFASTDMAYPKWVQYDLGAPMDDPLCPYGKNRTLLQWWGAEYRRAQDPDYWVKKLAKCIEEENPEYALITDMRFPNEMQFVKQHGETVRVDRAGLPPSTHTSETALADTSDEDWSIILENNGTLEEFKEGAVVVFDELTTHFPYGYNDLYHRAPD